MKLKEIKLGKLNILDLMIISVIVIFIGIFAVGKMVVSNTGNDEAISVADATFSYTFFVEGLSETSKEMFKVGDEVYERESNVCIGKITNLDITKAKELLYKNNGEIIESEMPGKIDVKLSIETNGTIKNGEYLANNLIRIMVGANEQIKTKYVMCTGTVLGVEK